MQECGAYPLRWTLLVVSVGFRLLSVSNTLNFKRKTHAHDIYLLHPGSKLRTCVRDNDPGFQPLQLSPPAPAQCVAVDPCHVFEESFLEDFVLWWTWHDTRTPLYIAGPTGCGKTTSVLQFLARVNVPVISVTCSRRFVKDDLVGRWGAHEGSFAWIDGPATIAWKTGAVLLINEFSLAPPEV